jgi:16S rRNA (guanine527-N7)-methyltransferase
LKGGDLKEEMKSVKYRYKEYNLSNFFKEEFFETKKIIHVII